MPSVSPAQHKLMLIAAHTKGGYGGVPQAVGEDFVAADAAKEIPDHMRKKIAQKLMQK